MESKRRAAIAVGNEDPGFLRDVFLRACSHLPCGVAIVAGMDEKEGPFGLTVSSATFVSLDPPLLSVCIDRNTPQLKQLRRAKQFSVNLLRQEQEELASRFASKAANRFEGVTWYAEENGAPALPEAAGTILCTIHREFEAGDHQLVLGEVRRVMLRGGEPLVYWRRAFHRLHVRYPFAESESDLENFVRRWEAGKLPRAEWTHGAHVGVAAYYAFEHRGEELFGRMKSGITFHNTSVGTQNTEDNGYHETLTRFWSGVVEEFVRNGEFRSRLEAVRGTVERYGEDRDRHRLFYKFDVVRDRRARREWVLPDRQPPVAAEEV